MRIQHNIMAMSAYRNYTNNVSAMKKNLEKLSSGYKINRAGDDAAGLAISEKMRAQITGLETAQKNAKDGISLVQTAEGALTEVHDMLNRMVELATQSANGTYDNTTDRAQMQKEVNQLLSEIDRIADSSNFNGINLLDGTLGLNTDAFKIAAGDDYAAAVDPVSKNIELTDAAYHGGTSVQQVNPEFTIDLHDIQIVNKSSNATKVSFKIQVGGASIVATTANNVAKGAAASVAQIAAALNAAIASGKNNFAKLGTDTTNQPVAIKIGGLAFKASVVDNTKLHFTYVGVGSGATGKADNITAASKSKLINTSSLATTFNTQLHSGVTVTAAGAQATKTEIASSNEGKYYCNIIAPKDAVAFVDAKRPGADIDLTGNVKNGYKLTIADGTGNNANKTTYVFKTDKNSKVSAGNNETLIDVSSIEGTAAQEKAAALMIAGGQTTKTVNSKPVQTGHANGSNVTAAGGKFQVSVGSGAKIHIDVISAANASIADSKEKMQKLISFTDAGKPAQAANTKLTVTASAIKDGNTISITDGTTTTKYVFTDDAAKLKLSGNELPANTKYVEIAKNGTAVAATKTIDNLVAKIGSTAVKGTDGKTITISAAKADADVAAPVVLGKGLTLQIGDTSDDFNQLNVAVQDMHSASIGVGKLDISTEEAAQAAVNKIKAAINTVSDVRGTLGATQNRLDHTINNLGVMTENIQDAESTIRDVDVAEEMMAYTKNNILIQSAQAMLAQANQVPQGVLQLLQ